MDGTRRYCLLVNIKVIQEWLYLFSMRVVHVGSSHKPVPGKIVEFICGYKNS
jgi:hypothetical protein